MTGLSKNRPYSDIEHQTIFELVGLAKRKILFSKLRCQSSFKESIQI